MFLTRVVLGCLQMRVIDFIGLGSEDTVYVISEKGASPMWKGTRQDFIREMTAFFMLFHRLVIGFVVVDANAMILYI